MRITNDVCATSNQSSPTEDLIDGALIESMRSHDHAVMFTVDLGVPFRLARIVYEPELGWSLLPMTMTDQYFRCLVRDRMLRDRGITHADILGAQTPGPAIIGPLLDTSEFLSKLPAALTRVDFRAR